MPELWEFIKVYGPLGNFVLLLLGGRFLWIMRANDMKHIEESQKELKEDVKYIREKMDRLIERFL